MNILDTLVKSNWFWKLAGLFGCLFVLTWTGLGLTLLADTLFTGGSEWAPWAAQEAASRGEYLASYVVISAFGLAGSFFLVRWTWPMFK